MKFKINKDVRFNVFLCGRVLAEINGLISGHLPIASSRSRAASAGATNGAK